jgi:tetratricopeptide (TPR) repeat protein
MARDFLVRNAEGFARKGDFRRAALVVRLARESGPEYATGNPRIIRNEMSYLSLDERYDEAVRLGEELLAAVPDGGPLWDPTRLELAQALAAAGRPERALDLLGKIETRPGVSDFTRARVLVDRGVVLQSRERYEEALRVFLDAAERFAGVESQSSTAIANAARIFALSGHTDEARRLIRSKRAVAPRSAPWIELDWSLDVIEGKYGKVTHGVEQRILAGPDPARSPLSDGVLLCILDLLSGNEERAHRRLEVLERTYSVTPVDARALPVPYLLGKATEEDLRKNLRLFPLLFSVTPVSGLFCLLGLVREREGKTRQARALFRFAVEADPLRYWAAVLSERRLNERSRPGGRASPSKDHPSRPDREDGGRSLPARARKDATRREPRSRIG